MPASTTVPTAAPTIETERLRLRAFALADKPAYAEMRADPDFVRFLVGGEALIAFATEIAESRIIGFNEAWSDGYGVWAVEEKASGELIGHAGLAKLERYPDVEVLYAFKPAAWGRGFAREAAAAALAYGFEQAALQRVVAFVMPENRASSRVLDAIGLRSIGAVTYNDFPVLGYAISAEEWAAEQRP